MTARDRALVIANCSGFYGDRLSAAAEVVEGGPIDVLSGDYLAELTMLILAKAQAKDQSAGYATTFLTQLEEVLATCLERGIKIVANAGGLNPAGLAVAIRELAARLGLDVAVGHVEGDDLRRNLTAVRPSVTETPVSANAYLGGFGIAAALEAGADVVVTGRVSDASLVVGPAVWWHGWSPTDWDSLAGAVVAGHVLECGTQATGGNYPFLQELPNRDRPGFPLAEIEADGTSTITKHPGTGGLVSVGTVTAQVLYEIADPAYLGPDVTAHFDTITLTPAGNDRVAVSGVLGSAPPPTLKVALNEDGGYRNTMTLVLTGLELETKAAWAEEQLFAALGGRERFREVEVQLLRFDRPDAPTNAQATAHLRITVKDSDARKVGRAFSNATMELALGGYPGFHTTTPPTEASAYGIYRAAAVPRDAVQHVAVLPDGARITIPDPPVEERLQQTVTSIDTARPAAPTGRTRRVPLGIVCGARSGDKGGNANIGLWTRDDDGYAWACAYLTTERLRTLLGVEAESLPIERFELPNLRALNVVVHGLLGDGVASSTRADPQAKGLGEYLRSRLVDVPETLLPEGGSP